MPDARKPATFGSNDGRLEQILWHSENDPEEAILDELTDLSTREARTDAEQAQMEYLRRPLSKQIKEIFTEGLHGHGTDQKNKNCDKREKFECFVGMYR